MWNIKCFVILVIIGTAENVTKGLKNLEKIPEKHSITSPEKKTSCTRDIAHNKESATI
jgi:hypothetical protein